MPKSSPAITEKTLGQVHTWRKANIGGIFQRIKLYIMFDNLVKSYLILDILLNFPAT